MLTVYCVTLVRICPGRFLVDSSVWYLMAGITATFDISRCIGKDGQEIVPPFDITLDLVR